ncbi:virulence-associated E family protein [Flavobacterium sp. TR2]|uniref:virulence-associated E family protein n=1 Tax=Flavobacterium sp. TR2 TaxID=2977321 RepID=UPI0021B0FBB9|nr:virulence-associated E family protein [Flavobacterium sp. TR2]UWY29362.1 virulence-associated E family protein [Flavobacterium sp. TR2]
MKDKSQNKLYHSNTASNTIFDRIIKYVDSKYRIRFNTISLDYEINIIGNDNWESLNLNSLLIELTRNNIETNYNKLEILIKSNLIERYNPIEEYLLQLPNWNKEVDFIKKLASYVKTNDDEAFVYHLKKWFARAVKCAIEKEKINKHAIILANGDQHAGKSTYFQFFIPKVLSSYIAEDIGTDKDSRVKMCKNLIINLEELNIMGKTDVNYLKSLISKVFINERLPYERRAENLPRICSFVGSTNRTEFLTDETGSVRWIIFDVIGRLNFKYSKEINMDDVWSQAYYLAYCDKNFEPELTQQDVIDNEKRNEKYTSLTIEQETVIKYFEKSDNTIDFYTATEIMTKLIPIGLKLNREKIGKALSGFKFNRIKHPQKQVYGYLAKPKFKISPVEIMN